MLLRAVFAFVFFGEALNFGGRDSFVLFIVPNVFASSSQGVLSICSSIMFPISPHFYVICFAQKLSSFHYIPGPKGRHSRFLS
jgi:hypothetical protein